jgi:hypothetical protein
MSKFINNWAPEVRSLIRTLEAHGCKILTGSNGGPRFGYPSKSFLAEITACDEAHLYVTTPSSPLAGRYLYLVFGNSPGELVCDHEIDPAIDAATDAHYAKWDGRKQPTKLCPHYAAEAKRVARIAYSLNARTEPIFYGLNGNDEPIAFPEISGAKFYTREGVSFGRKCNQLWYGVVGAAVQTEVLPSLLLDRTGSKLFPR